MNTLSINNQLGLDIQANTTNIIFAESTRAMFLGPTFYYLSIELSPSLLTKRMFAECAVYKVGMSLL